MMTSAGAPAARAGRSAVPSMPCHPCHAISAISLLAIVVSGDPAMVDAMHKYMLVVGTQQYDRR